MTANDAGTRLFSIEDANRTLPLVRLIVRDIAELHSDLQSRRERLDDLTSGRRRAAARGGDPYAEEIQQMESEYADDERRLGDLIEELAQLGVQIHDAGGAGAVVFPGRQAKSLIWKLGDADVRQETPDHTLNLYSPTSLLDADGMPRETH